MIGASHPKDVQLCYFMSDFGRPDIPVGGFHPKESTMCGLRIECRRPDVQIDGLLAHGLYFCNRSPPPPLCVHLNKSNMAVAWSVDLRFGFVYVFLDSLSHGNLKLNAARLAVSIIGVSLRYIRHAATIN